MPDFLLSYEEYKAMQEPPMRNFTWKVTTQTVAHAQLHHKNMLLGLGPDSYYDKPVKKKMIKCCTCLNLILFLWLLSVLGCITYLLYYEILPDFEFKF